MRTTSLLLLLLTACSGGPEAVDDGPGDAVRYAEAIAAGAEGLSLCAGISDDQTRYDCVSNAARELAAQKRIDEAQGACASIPEGEAWRDECAFQVSDGAMAMGEDAKTLCEMAGRYRSKCIEHATSRTLAQSLKQLPRGEEAEAEARALELAGELLGPKRALRFVRTAVARRIAAREDAVFSLETCGTAPMETCRRALRLRIQEPLIEATMGTGGQSVHDLVRPHCPAPVDRDAVVAAGFTDWAPEVEELAQEQWRIACTEAQKAGRSPRGPEQAR